MYYKKIDYTELSNKIVKQVYDSLRAATAQK